MRVACVMDVHSVAWYLMYLADCNLCICSNNYFKFLLVHTAYSTEHAILRVAPVPTIALQVAASDGTVTCTNLTAPAGVSDCWGYLIARVHRIVTLRGCTRVSRMLDIDLPTINVHPRDSVQFIVGYGEQLCGITATVHYNDTRPAFCVLLRVCPTRDGFDTMWIDLKERCADITFTSGLTQTERIVYCDQARLRSGPYKWTHSSHATTLKLCSAVVSCMHHRLTLKVP